MAGPVSLLSRSQRLPLKWHEPRVRAVGVRWYNSPIWIGKTLYQDIKHYRHAPRPLSTRRLLAAGSEPKRPVFIVGAPRSGTDFIGDCIAALQSVSYHREPVITKGAVKHLFSGEWSEERGARVFRAIYRGLLAIHLANDLRFVEKTPRNVFIVPFLARTFPDAAFIHVLRDGRDVALSYSEKPWARQAFAITRRRDPSGQLYGPYAQFWTERERVSEFETTSDIHRSAWAWRAHVEAALEGQKVVPSEQWLEVRYERLMREPLFVGEQLLDFMSVQDAAQRVAFERALSAADPHSIGRFRRCLTAEQIRQVEREAGPLLRRLGYLT